jgi:P-type Ca2+ transporter type 2C
MARRGLRVLAVGVGKSEREEHITLLGLVGIADPPRTEAVEAVKAARAAGITTVMITGDHPATAEAIARELGIMARKTPAPRSCTPVLRAKQCARAG